MPNQQRFLRETEAHNEHDLEAFLRWGLGLMVDLVDAEVLTEARALKVAATIQCANPTHIAAGLIVQFRDRLRER